MYHTNQNGIFFLGVLAGGVVATLTTLLFTTKKGAQIQKAIVDTYHEIEDSVGHAGEAAKETAHEAETALKHGIDKLKKETSVS